MSRLSKYNDMYKIASGNDYDWAQLRETTITKAPGIFKADTTISTQLKTAASPPAYIKILEDAAQHPADIQDIDDEGEEPAEVYSAGGQKDPPPPPPQDKVLLQKMPLKYAGDVKVVAGIMDKIKTKTFTCYGCGQPGHKRGDPNCPKYVENYTDPRAASRNKPGESSKRGSFKRKRPDTGHQLMQEFLQWKRGRTGPGKPSRKQCRFYAKGNCRHGEQCKFLHGTKKEIDPAMAALAAADLSSTD